ncbi:MAG: uroporphyrinogen decarboxylase family protein [Saccharofermentanales bacterium]
MKNEMTPRERIMTALSNKVPDRVPATPDISIMIPCKLTGKPFWEIEINSNPSLASAYIDAAKFFGIDGWMFNGTLQYKHKSQVSYESKIIRSSPEIWEVQHIIHTPDGDMTQTLVSPWNNPSTLTEKPMKDIREDFKKVKHLFSDVIGYDDTIYKQQKKEMGDQGMICCFISPPGLTMWSCTLMGLEDLTYAYYDYPELFEELTELNDKVAVQQMEMAIDAGVESILTGGSGSITLQSPELFRKLTLPTIKKVTKMCKDAGIISGIHSCGKENYLVESCANETDLDYVNPLEIPPMGDCDLADIKSKFGSKLALMGNLHTTKVMLNGSVDDVRRESLKAIRDAGAGGGFVLSTGDQCGRDTPFENIFEMVRVSKEFGSYPLDMDKISEEIKKLEKLK